jgi:hypothetical protein
MKKPGNYLTRIAAAAGLTAAAFIGIPAIAQAAPPPPPSGCDITGHPGTWTVTLRSASGCTQNWRTYAKCGTPSRGPAFGGWHGSQASSEASCFKYAGEVGEWGYETADGVYHKMGKR